MVTSPEDSTRSGRLRDVGDTFHGRFYHREVIEDIGNAIRVGEMGVTPAPLGEYRRGAIVTQLSTYWPSKYLHIGGQEGLHKAIQIIRKR